MDLTLPPEDLDWQRRAKVFAETVLFPHELDLEMSGSLPRATKDALRKAVVAHVSERGAGLMMQGRSQVRSLSQRAS